MKAITLAALALLSATGCAANRATVVKVTMPDVAAYTVTNPATDASAQDEDSCVADLRAYPYCRGN